MKRRHALASLAGLALSACGGQAQNPNAVAIGSKDFTEQYILGELYAALLEKHGLTVTRKLGLGGTQVAMEALQRGDIDLYPEYTGTALVAVLHLPPTHDPQKNYELVRDEYRKRYDLEWLPRSPFNDSEDLATTPAIAAKYGLHSLRDLSKMAPQLRMGAMPEFTKRDDGLPGLQKTFGGFQFKELKLFATGLRYKAIESGSADVILAFTTDGQIATDHLVLMADDTHFFPEYNVAPVVRRTSLAKHPQIAEALNPVAPLLTDAVMRDLNAQVDGQKKDPADVARGFLTAHGLV